MKNFTGMIAAAFTSLSLSAQMSTSTDGFYFEKSKYPFTEKELVWKKRADHAVIRLGYWKGDCCGSVPEAKQITARISNDTVFTAFIQNGNLTAEPKPAYAEASSIL